MKILVIRFSSIGDIVLTTPVLRCLKQQTQAEIHFLTKKSFAKILSANPYVDKIFAFEKSVSEVISDLKSVHYDQVIDLHHNLRSLYVKLALGRPAHSFNKLNLEKWLLVNWGIDRMPDVHIVHRYMETLAPLGVAYDGQGLDFFMPVGNERLPEDMALPHSPYVAFVLGATHATKRLPVEKISAICQQIKQPVVLLGGPAEAQVGAIVAQNAPENVIDLSGKLTLFQSAALVRDAQRVITHDTGLMHIAAAFRKPIISVWGNTLPSFGMYPFYPDGLDLNQSVEVKGLKCRPCSKIGYSQCPKSHFKCMQEIDIEQIVKKIP